MSCSLFFVLLQTLSALRGAPPHVLYTYLIKVIERSMDGPIRPMILLPHSSWKKVKFLFFGLRVIVDALMFSKIRSETIKIPSFVSLGHDEHLALSKKESYTYKTCPSIIIFLAATHIHQIVYSGRTPKQLPSGHGIFLIRGIRLLDRLKTPIIFLSSNQGGIKARSVDLRVVHEVGTGLDYADFDVGVLCQPGGDAESCCTATDDDWSHVRSPVTPRFVCMSVSVIISLTIVIFLLAEFFDAA